MSKQQQYKLKSFTGQDGQQYERRCDISMRLWKRYTEATYSTVFEKAVWVALFVGKLPESILDEPQEEQTERAMDALTMDEYYAVHMKLFEDIIYPAAPESEKKSDESGNT